LSASDPTPRHVGIRLEISNRIPSSTSFVSQSNLVNIPEANQGISHPLQITVAIREITMIRYCGVVHLVCIRRDPSGLVFYSLRVGSWDLRRSVDSSQLGNTSQMWPGSTMAWLLDQLDTMD